jgi:signal transduction histidine kinase
MRSRYPDLASPFHFKAAKEIKMRLAPFIRANETQIISEWERFAATLIPAAGDMTPLALRDHIKEILAFIAEDIEAPQTPSEQELKSKGGKDRAPGGHSAAQTHAALRLAGGFTMDQMISEYRALRASITKLWQEQISAETSEHFSDLIRFDEAIDQQLTESVRHYSKKLADSKDLFLGILSHDLRNPLNSIIMAAKLTLALGPLNDRQKMLVSQSIDSAERATEIVTYLLDLTSARLGHGLPVVREPMDMGFVSRMLVDEMRSAHPNRDFDLKISGNLEGEWDKARIGQVLSILLGNAVQYSFTDSRITIEIEGGPEEVTLSIHNEGVPIPSNAVDRIFDSLTRATVENSENHPGSTCLGLGLYIAREVVCAHDGTIDVTSSERKGTTFTVYLPRHGEAEVASPA